MIALLEKDIFVLWKQMRYYVVLMVIYMFVPILYLNIFGIVYAAIMPYTATAYDERSKWDQLAAMMPYRIRDLVVSKYLLGWIVSAVSAAGVLIVRTVLTNLNIFPSEVPVTPDIVLATFGIAVIIIAATMPLLFRFGVEKGRLMMFFMIFLVAIGGGAFASIVEDIAVSKPTLPSFVTAATSLGSLSILLLAVVLTPISIRLYRK